MILKKVVQMRLHRKRLLQELFIELLLGGWTVNKALSFLVFTRSCRPPQYLKHVGDGVIDEAVFNTVIPLNAEDRNEVGSDFEFPAHFITADDYLDGLCLEHLDNDSLFLFGHTLVEEPDS